MTELVVKEKRDAYRGEFVFVETVYREPTIDDSNACLEGLGLVAVLVDDLQKMYNTGLWTDAMILAAQGEP